MRTDLLSNWEQVQLIDVCLDKGQYGSGASAIEYDSKKPRYVRITDIDDGGKLKSTDLRSPSQVEEKYFLENEDFLFARSGSVGRTYLHEKKGGVFQFAGYLIRFKLNQKLVLPKYLYYVTKSKFYWEWIEKQQKSVTISNINAQQYASFRFLRPLIDVQKNIISILENAEKAKEFRNEADDLTKEFLKAVFLEIFGDPITNNKKWKTSTIGENLVEIKYGTGSPPEYAENGLKFIRATNIKDGRIIENGIFHISKEEAKKIEKCRLVENDLIIVRSGVNTGDCATITKEYSDSYGGYDIIFHPDNKILNSTFLNELLNLGSSKSILKQLSRRAGQPHINSEQVSNFKIILPPIDLQNKFESIVKEIEKVKDHQKQSMEYIRNLFNYLIQKSFNGELIC